MKKSTSKKTLIILLTIITSFCYGQDKQESLIENLEKYLDKHKIPGAMISIVRRDTTVFVGGIGYADIENDEKVSDQHLFRQGSISKSFTALGLFKALKESSYDLNSPLRDLDKSIPFMNEWENTHPVQVSHLLEHTSGFEDFHLHAMYNTKDSVMPPVINMVNDHRQSLYSRWRPGTKKAYSNPNYIIAGHLIEVLSGSSFEDYVKANILTPIGMESSGYHFKEPEDKRFAKGYKRTGTELNQRSFATINGSPAGDFCANAKDMALFLQFMLNRDSAIFTEKEFDRIETPQTSIVAKKGLTFGYGLGNYPIWKNGYLFHGHGGEIDGFAARYIYSRDADLGIAVAINRNGNANAIVDIILNHLVSSQNQPPTTIPSYPIPDSIKSSFAGFYEFKSPKNELLAFSEIMFGGFIIDFEEDMLIRKRILGRPKDTLYYAGNHQFYFSSEGVASAMLIEADAGKPTFWINDNYTEQESRAKRLVILFGLLASFLLLFLFFLYSLIWLIRNFLRKEKTNSTNHLVQFGIGLMLILMFVGFGFAVGSAKPANKPNLYSLLMYCSSYALLLLTAASVYRWFRLPNKKAFRIFYVLTSIAAISISIYLIDIGFIGLKLWNY